MSAPLPRKPITCVICGETFYRPGNQNKITCSQECQRERELRKNRAYTARDNANLPRTTAVCVACGAEFVKIATTNRITCSEECSAQYRHIRAVIVVSLDNTKPILTGKCKWCGHLFQRNSDKQIYCSMNCFRLCDAARKRAKRPSRAKATSKPKPAPLTFTHDNPYIRCVRSNDLYAAGQKYERHMVITDIKHGDVSREDFEL